MKKMLVVLSVLALTGMASAGVVTHLEADSLGLADGAAVGTWTDLSGLGNDATQATAGAQPTYVASNAAFNGYATVQFDGASDWMDMVDVVDVDSFTLFVVGRVNQLGGDQYFISGQPGSGDSRLRVAQYGWSSWWKFRAGTTDMTSLLEEKDTEKHVFAMTGTADVWQDGVFATSATNTATSTAALVMGAYDDVANGIVKGFLNGEIAEVILYDEILSANDVESINAQLVAKYAVPEPATMVLLGLGSLLIRRKK